MKMSKLFLGFLCSGLVTSVLFSILTTGAAAETRGGQNNEQSLGWTLGPFMLLPELSLSGAYDSNIYATQDAEVSDRRLILVPSLAIKSSGETHRFRLNMGAQLTRFEDNDTEDSDDYWLNANGRYNLGAQSHLFGGFALSQKHEERGSPEDVDGREPTVYFSSGLHLGTEFTSHNLSLRFGGTLQDLDFDDVPTFTTTINNDDRDRSLYGLGLRASYKLNSRHSPFLQLIYDQRNYVQDADDNSFIRDSQGYRAALGLKSEWATLSSEIYAGTLWQDYDDARFKTVSDLDCGVRVSWKPRSGTKIILNLERDLNETTLAESSGYLSTAAQLTLVQQLANPLSLSGQVRFTQDDYQQITRKDDILDAGVGFKYDLSRHLYLAADYSFIQQDSKPKTASSLTSNDYERQLIFVTLGIKI